MKRVVYLILVITGLAIAGGVGTVLFMSDDNVKGVMATVPGAGAYTEQFIEAKHRTKNAVYSSVGQWIDYGLYRVRFAWRDMVYYAFINQIPRVVVELEVPKVRIKADNEPVQSDEPVPVKTDAPLEETQPAETLSEPVDESEDTTATAPPETADTSEPSEPSEPQETASRAETPPAPEVSPSLIEPVEKAEPVPPAAAPEGDTGTDIKQEQDAAIPEKPKEPEKQEKKQKKVAVEPAPPPAAPETDDGTAAHRKGLAHYKGIDTEKDFKAARVLFEEAAEKGHAAAQYNLGIMAYLGQGMEQNYTVAANWFRMAAEQDHALAQYNLGFLYYGGKGVEKDDLQAFMWIDRAATLGEQKAIDARDTLTKVLPEDVFKKE